MATGGRFSVSLSGGHDEIFDHCCTPCSNQGNTKEAFHQCVDCEEYFCGKCIDFHSRFGATSGHKVLGKDQMGKAAGSSPQKQLPTLKCLVHHGQSIEVYCADHDVICCNTCVSISHTNCNGKTYIVDAAKGVKTGEKLETTRERLTTALKEIKKGRDSRQTELETQSKVTAARVKQVEEFAETLIKRIRDLKGSAVAEITRKHKGLGDETVADITAMDDMILVVEEDLRKLGQIQKKPNSQVFIDIMLGQGHEAEVMKMLERITRPRQSGFNFSLNTEIEAFLGGDRSLAVFADDNKVYNARLSGSYRYNVKIREDTGTCDIVGPCLLPDGTMVVTDWANKRLKHLDTSYTVTDHYNMQSKPWGVTCTAPGEVAVTMTRLKKVQFVSTGASMSLTRSFSTSDKCRGVCYSKGELFVSCGGLTILGMGEGPGHVAVYDLRGTQLRTVQTDPSGQNIFSVPRHISISSDGSKVYVADWKNDIILLDRIGKGVCSFSDQSLNHAFGVCTLNNGHILVSGMDSNNVLQFDGDGKNMAEILGDTAGLRSPLGLCYDGNKSRLVVSTGNMDIIKVFELV